MLGTPQEKDLEELTDKLALSMDLKNRIKDIEQELRVNWRRRLIKDSELGRWTTTHHECQTGREKIGVLGNEIGGNRKRRSRTGDENHQGQTKVSPEKNTTMEGSRT